MADPNINYELHSKFAPPVTSLAPIGYFLKALRFDEYKGLLGLAGSLAAYFVPFVMGICGIFFALLFGIISLNLSVYIKRYPFLIWSISIGIGCLVLSELVRGYFRRNMSKRLREGDLHRGFRVLQNVQICVPLSKNKCLYYYRYYVQSHKESQSSFPMRFQWAGNGTHTISLRNPLFKARERPLDNSPYTLLEVFFDKPLRAGSRDVIEFCISTEVNEGSVQPGYLTLFIPCAKFPRFNTFLIVVFSEAIKAASIRMEQFLSATADYPFKHDAGRLDEHNQIAWPIPVRVGWRYCISWQLEV